MVEDDPRRHGPASEEDLMNLLVFFQVLNRAIAEGGVWPQEKGLWFDTTWWPGEIELMK